MSFVSVLFGQTSVIGGTSRYDRARCRDMKLTCREVARVTHGEPRFAAGNLKAIEAVEDGPTPCWCGGESPL